MGTIFRQGPASALGSQTQARSFDRDHSRPGGSYVPRTQHGESKPYSRDYENEDRQWRGNPRPEPVHQQPVSNVRPKLDLKPRTVTEDTNRVAHTTSVSEDPFGGPIDQDKLKRQAEMQAQREAEAAAKHKLNQPTGGNKGQKDEKDGFRSQGKSENDSGAWRSNRVQEEKEAHPSDNKYRFNKGGNDSQTRGPQRNFDNKSNNNNSHHGQSTNTFESLASGRDKW